MTGAERIDAAAERYADLARTAEGWLSPEGTTASFAAEVALFDARRGIHALVLAALRLAGHLNATYPDRYLSGERERDLVVHARALADTLLP